MVFWAYNPTYTGQGGERWVTPEKFADMKRRHLANAIKRYHSNPAERAEAKVRAKRWKARNPDKNAAINRAWFLGNKDRIYAQQVRRRQVVKSSLDSSQIPWIRQVYAASARVSKCTGIPFHVDHINPLARGGEHRLENLQILPAKINQSKGARVTAAFPTKK
jgi:5-methylcytosine-specific restriction endonuclease McrA